MEAKLAAEKNETKKIALLNDYAEFLAPNYFKIAYDYSKQALDLSDKTHNIQGKVNAYNNIGDAYWYHGDFIKAEKYYFDAYKLTILSTMKKVWPNPSIILDGSYACSRARPTKHFTCLMPFIFMKRTATTKVMFTGKRRFGKSLYKSLQSN